MNLWDTIVRGEYVMFALALMLVAAVAIWWARGASLKSLSKKNINLMNRIRDYIMEGDIENARELAEVSTFPGAKVIEAGVTRLGRPVTEIISAMELASSAQNPTIERGRRWLYGIAIMAPLIGAAGSLAGICDAFRNAAEAGGDADLALLSSMIAPALVATVAGLGVGVFAIFAFYCLDGAIAKAKNALSNLTLDFADLLNEPS